MKDYIIKIDPEKLSEDWKSWMDRDRARELVSQSRNLLIAICMNYQPDAKYSTIYDALRCGLYKYIMDLEDEWKVRVNDELKVNQEARIALNDYSVVDGMEMTFESDIEIVDIRIMRLLLLMQTNAGSILDENSDYEKKLDLVIEQVELLADDVDIMLSNKIFEEYGKN